MPSCKEVLARHSEYLDGEMAAGDAELWRTHLANCAACARYDRVLRKGLGALRHGSVATDPEFMLHLRYRLAYEEQRMALGPVTAGAATSVTVAAVLALAAWAPIMFMSRMQAERDEANAVAAELSPTTSEIAWHGTNASAFHPALSPATPATGIASTPAAPAVSLIDRGYTPLILDPPTAPPSYTQVTFTTLGAR